MKFPKKDDRATLKGTLASLELLLMIIPLLDFVIVPKEMDRLVEGCGVPRGVHLDHEKQLVHDDLRSSLKTNGLPGIPFGKAVMLERLLRVSPYASSERIAPTILRTATSRRMTPLSRDDAAGEDKQPEGGV